MELILDLQNGYFLKHEDRTFEISEVVAKELLEKYKQEMTEEKALRLVSLQLCVCRDTWLEIVYDRSRFNEELRRAILHLTTIASPAPAPSGASDPNADALRAC